MAPQKKAGKGKGRKEPRPHQNCLLANFPPGAIRLCFEGVNGNPAFRGWQFCSRGRHCLPAAAFQMGGRSDWQVCARHLEQSQASKSKGSERRGAPAPRGPRQRTVLGPKTPNKIARPRGQSQTTSSARGRRTVQIKEESPTPMPKNSEPKEDSDSEGLFVGSDEDGEYEVDDAYVDEHPPRFTKQRTPDDDDDDEHKGGQMGGGLTGQLLSAY